MGKRIGKVRRSGVLVSCEKWINKGGNAISCGIGYALPKYTTKISITNCTICIVVKYFFH
jgi:hypothetical protein